MGRSTKPLEDLLEEIHYQYKERATNRTIIRRPNSFYKSEKWDRVTDKARRAIDSIILKADRKIEILSDIKEYLDPATKEMYIGRGIPYRRGYLFHGRPGTGKIR